MWVLLGGVDFVGDGRLRKRVWLWHLWLFVWVVEYCGGLSWVVAGIALLESIANVDARALATLRDSDSTGPSQRLDHVDGVRDGLTFAALRVELSVADDLAQPGWLLLGEAFVLTDVTEALNCWVLCFGFLHGCR